MATYFVFRHSGYLSQKNNSVIVTCQTNMLCCFFFFYSCPECVWRSQLRNVWPWRSSLIVPRPEMRLEETLCVINACCLLSLAISICFVPSAWLISVFINSCFSFSRQSVSWDPSVCLYRLFVRSIAFLWDSLIRSLSMSLAAFCFDQACSHKLWSSETRSQNKQHSTQALTAELWTLSLTNRYTQILPLNNILFRHLYHHFKWGCSLDTDVFVRAW